ncbi:MAG: hypothetical protein R3C04_01785 [Hyphomonas sp.]
MRFLLALIFGVSLAGGGLAQTLSSATVCDASDPRDCETVSLSDEFLEHDYNVFWQSAWGGGFGYKNDLYRLTELRDEAGATIAKAKKGEGLMILSRTAYARVPDKTPGAAQLFLTRKGSKPVKVQFKEILYAYGTPFGVVSTQSGNKKERPDSRRLNGTIQAITENGQLGAVYENVLDIVDYGDFTVLVYRQKGGVQIFDKHLSPLSPVLTDAWLFQTNYADSEGYGYEAYESRRAIYGMKVFDGGGDRKKALFRLIPKDKGAALPENLLGVTPISYAGWGESDCLDPEQKQCVMRVRSFIAVWARPDGEPEVSLVDARAETWEPIRYKSFDWYEGLNFKGLIAEQFDGQFRIITPVTKGDGSVEFVYLPEVYPNALDAQIGAKRQEYIKAAEIYAKAQADYEYQKARYEAYEKRLAEKRAAEESKTAEIVSAEEIINSGDHNRICAEASNALRYYTREMLVSACVAGGGMFADVPVDKQDFWSAMMAGLRSANQALAAANSRTYNGGFSATYSGGYAPASDNGDFNRSMQSIDNALNRIADPNWNGAAAASW